MATLAKAMTNAYVHDGSWSTFRGRSHGRRPHGLPGSRFVTFLQNHDQVGNRASGDRLSQLVSPGMLRVGAALLLTSPFVPMLFMGEEWGARTPWQFFSSFAADELAEAVRAGRSAEFAAFGWEPGDIPDPQDPETARRSTLDWSEPEREPQASLLAWYRWLIRLRKAWPELNDGRRDLVRCAYDDGARWFVMHRGRISVACNFADTVLGRPDARRAGLRRAVGLRRPHGRRKRGHPRSGVGGPARTPVSAARRLRWVSLHARAGRRAPGRAGPQVARRPLQLRRS